MDVADPEIAATLARHVPGLAAVWLFGSEAAGTARADSDVDYGVVSNQGLIARVALHEARFALEALLNRDVDVVDLAAAPAVLAWEATWLGRRLAAADGFYADLFEIRAAREYEDHMIRIAPHLEDIRARGRVFP